MVGRSSVKFLSELGVKVVAVSDSKGMARLDSGLDWRLLAEAKRKHGTVVKYPGAEQLSGEEIYGLDVDILVPAAIGGDITEANAGAVKAKVIAEAANMPLTEGAEKVLEGRGAVVIPDIICNAGGVIASYCEYIGKTADDAFSMIEAKISRNVKEVLEKSRDKDLPVREVATYIAKERVREAMAARGWSVR